MVVDKFGRHIREKTVPKQRENTVPKQASQNGGDDVVNIYRFITFSEENDTVDMRDNRIVRVRRPKSPSDAATKGYCDSLKDISRWNGMWLSMGGKRLIHVADPIDDSDVATKRYVHQLYQETMQKDFGYFTKSGKNDETIRSNSFEPMNETR